MSEALPTDWSRTAVADAAHIEMGQAPAGADVRDSGDGLPFIQGNAEFGARHPAPEKVCIRPRKTARAGDLLISVRAPVGALNVADQALAIGRGLAALRFERLEPEFAWHALQRAVGSLARVAQGSTFSAINKKELAGLVLPAPPLPEQRKIAAILTSVDEVIENTEAVIEQLQVVKKAMMQELLTRGLPGRHTRFKQTEIGEIPEEWEVVRVADVSPSDRPCAQTGPFGQQLRPSEFVETGVPVLKIGNVRWGYMSFDNLDFVTEAKAEELSRFVVREGDLLFARQGATTGRNALADAQCEGSIINYHIIRVAVDPARCDPRFLSICFNSTLVQDQVGRNKKRGNRDGINTKQILGFQFPLPPLSEQRRIADSLDSVAANAHAHEAEVASLTETKSALMSVLLTGEVRVTPAEESA